MSSHVGLPLQGLSRIGFMRIWVLDRESWRVNENRVRRLYRLDGLQLGMGQWPQAHRAAPRTGAAAAEPTERWRIDFVHDALADGVSTRSMISGCFINRGTRSGARRTARARHHQSRADELNGLLTWP
jgi:hypothetical protein